MYVLSHFGERKGEMLYITLPGLTMMRPQVRRLIQLIYVLVGTKWYSNTKGIKFHFGKDAGLLWRLNISCMRVSKIPIYRCAKIIFCPDF